MTSLELRKKFLDFFESNEHIIVPSSSLVPENDPSVLLTTAGMQQFKPYYTSAADPLKDNHLGLGHPLGSKNVASIQKSFRTSDIDEVGDDTHLTFFEMLGNFSFGGYDKEKAIILAHDFIVKVLELNIDKVTVFSGVKFGNTIVPADDRSVEVWQHIDKNIRVKKEEDNFWGPTGDQGPCGPTTEIYVNDVEVWNIVFNEYYQQPDKTLSKLDKFGVDTGMGLERLLAVYQKKSSVFETDLFTTILNKLPNDLEIKDKRILADHLRAICFLVSDGLRPSNKQAGYVVRRLMRRVMTYVGVEYEDIFKRVIDLYSDFYKSLNLRLISEEFEKEIILYNTSKDASSDMLESFVVRGKGAYILSGYDIFNITSTLGTNIKDVLLQAKDLGIDLSKNYKQEYAEAFSKHQKLSKTSSVGMFKGGLVDHDPQTIKHHTAHHLLLAALRLVLGNHVLQRGSNVSSERLRIDFSHPEKVTSEQLKKVEHIVNDTIQSDLEVRQEDIPKAEAEKLGALAEFGAKYGDTVSVYTIFNKDGSVFSREFCGGPHVEHTGMIGHFKILKEEAVASGIRRVKATVS